MRTNETPVTRFVLDVNILLCALLHTGKISDIIEVAQMNFSATDPSMNSLRIMRGVAESIVLNDTSLEVHVTPHVWATTQYMLTHPGKNILGLPAFAPWEEGDAARSIMVLMEAFDSMKDFNWTTTISGAHDQRSLNSVLPQSMRKQPYGIDNEDRKVTSDFLAVAALPATAPVLTVLVTNDGGLQLANEWVRKNCSSFQGHLLPFSAVIMLPKQVAALLSARTSSRSLVAA